MELNEKQFIAGFNSGYLLAEYEPQILTSLLKQIHPVNSYVSGISFGQKEYDLEQGKIHFNDLDSIRQKVKAQKDKEHE